MLRWKAQKDSRDLIKENPSLSSNQVHLNFEFKAANRKDSNVQLSL